MSIKKQILKIILIFGIFILGLGAFPKNAEAAKAEEVINYYYRDYYVYDANYTSNYNVTTKILKFKTGYTRGAATRTQVSSSVSVRTYKYTYSYYTY